MSTTAEDPSPDPTSVPWPCRHAIMAAMDSDSRGAWRQVSKQACSDVYEATRSLKWNAQRQRSLALIARLHGTPPPAPTVLPTDLLAKLPGLKALDCSGMDALHSLDGLPVHLEAFTCHGTAIGGGVQVPLSSLASLREFSLSIGGLNLAAVPFDFVLSSPLTALAKLELVGASVDAAAAQQLFRALRLLPALEHLSLRNRSGLGDGRLGAQGASGLAESIAFLPHLRHLDLYHNRLGAEGMVALCPALQALTGLQHLSIGNNELGAAGAQAPAQILQTSTALQGLEVGGNGMGPLGEAMVMGAIRTGHSLRCLDISIMGLATAGVEAWARLATFVGLRSLNVGFGTLGPEGAALLAPALRCLTGLTALDLRYNSLGAAGARALSPALRLLTSLSELNLGYSDLGADGARALAPVLASLGALRSLALYGNNFGGKEAMAVLAPALRPLSGLTALDLSSNKLDAVAAGLLASAFTCLTRLQDLNLGLNPLEDAGAAALAPALGTLVGLTRLDLARNDLGNEAPGIELLALAIARLTGLRCLYLQNNGCVAALAPAIRQLTRIEDLWLDKRVDGLLAP